jgi:hypothetical protein
LGFPELELPDEHPIEKSINAAEVNPRITRVTWNFIGLLLGRGEFSR